MTNHCTAERRRAVFMGTPEFAATILRQLLAPRSPIQVVAVLTQPDKPVGRAQALTPSPVKILAQEHGVPVLQPLTLRRPAAVAALQRFQPHLGIVAAYGKILPADILAVPTFGHLNVHASLLPRWRGPWPIGAAILAGDSQTGVTIMRLDEGIDTGPLLARRSEPISSDDTTATLEARLAVLGAELLVDTLSGYVAGALVPQPQDDRAAIYCHPVRKADGILDWTRPATDLERQVRAMQPWPVASTTWRGKQLRVLKAHLADEAGLEAASSIYPGTVLLMEKRVSVVTGEGLLALDELQLEGRPVVPVRDFLNGYRHFTGSRLGE